MPSLNDPAFLATICATFLLAGFVKGVVGLGLPTISLGLFAATLDIRTGMALLIVPAFATNVWQSLSGGGAHLTIRRIWVFLCLATACVVIGNSAVAHVATSKLSTLLGVLLIVYALIGLTGMRFTMDESRQRWVGPVLGAINGVLTGMTGSYAIPGLMYLQALDLPRDRFIQAMGMLFTGSTIGVALALGVNNRLTPELWLISALALIPALIGMSIGQRLRGTLSETAFRRAFFTALLGLGAYIIAMAFYYPH